MIKGHVEIVQTLLNYSTNYKEVDVKKSTALELAIFYYYNDVIKILTNLPILVLLLYNNLYNST